MDKIYEIHLNTENGSFQERVISQDFEEYIFHIKSIKDNDHSKMISSVDGLYSGVTIAKADNIVEIIKEKNNIFVFEKYNWFTKNKTRVYLICIKE